MRIRAARAWSYEQARRGALEIHARTCADPAWCNYGEAEPAELEDDPALPWPERQELARQRLAGMRHCQAAVDAENSATGITRRRRPRRGTAQP